MADFIPTNETGIPYRIYKLTFDTAGNNTRLPQFIDDLIHESEFGNVGYTFVRTRNEIFIDCRLHYQTQLDEFNFFLGQLRNIMNTEPFLKRARIRISKRQIDPVSQLEVEEITTEKERA